MPGGAKVGCRCAREVPKNVVVGARNVIMIMGVGNDARSGVSKIRPEKSAKDGNVLCMREEVVDDASEVVVIVHRVNTGVGSKDGQRGKAVAEVGRHDQVRQKTTARGGAVVRIFTCQIGDVIMRKIGSQI